MSEEPSLKEQLQKRCAFYEADAAAAWDKCEERRFECERLRERIHFTESLILRLDGIHGPIINEYGKRYPMPIGAPGETKP